MTITATFPSCQGCRWTLSIFQYSGYRVIVRTLWFLRPPDCTYWTREKLATTSKTKKFTSRCIPGHSIKDLVLKSPSSDLFAKELKCRLVYTCTSIYDMYANYTSTVVRASLVELKVWAWRMHIIPVVSGPAVCLSGWLSGYVDIWNALALQLWTGMYKYVKG